MSLPVLVMQEFGMLYNATLHFILRPLCLIFTWPTSRAASHNILKLIKENSNLQEVERSPVIACNLKLTFRDIRPAPRVCGRLFSATDCTQLWTLFLYSGCFDVLRQIVKCAPAQPDSVRLKSSLDPILLLETISESFIDNLPLFGYIVSSPCLSVLVVVGSRTSPHTSKSHAIQSLMTFKIGPIPSSHFFPAFNSLLWNHTIISSVSSFIVRMQLQSIMPSRWHEDNTLSQPLSARRVTFSCYQENYGFSLQGSLLSFDWRVRQILLLSWWRNATLNRRMTSRVLILNRVAQLE
jgi:hypothetical protein